MSDIDKYWRLANYLTIIQMFMEDNFMTANEINKGDFKLYPYGHWGTSPGINFIYAHVSHFLKKCDIKDSQLIIGAGHASHCLMANLFIEGILSDYYPQIEHNRSGLKAYVDAQKIEPGLRPEISPFYPSTLYDGGELGYSLPVAMGMAMQNKHKFIVCVVGDGEAETGSISASWQCNKMLGKNAGFLLPIIHLNGYKMGNPSMFSYMTDEDINKYFSSQGYQTIFVNASHREMIDALDLVKEVYDDYRNDREYKIPVIVFKSPKGWTAPKDDLFKIENSIVSHKMPLPNPNTNEDSAKYIQKWIRSYRPEELFDNKDQILNEIANCLPEKEYLLGNSLKRLKEEKLQLPDISEFAIKAEESENIRILYPYLTSIMQKNKFKIFSPDELKSNKLIDLKKNDQLRDSNVIEILNENICQAMMQGVNISGGHSLFISYEGFAPIISSMLDQYVKYLFQTEKISWRKPIHSMNYLLTSECWTNIYSHQNPGLINSVIGNQSKYSRVYFPIDANCLLYTMQTALESVNRINIMISSKHMMKQYLDINEAEKFVKEGYIKKDYPGKKDLKLVLVAFGDNSMKEILAAKDLLFSNIGGFRIRIVAISEITKLGDKKIYPHAYSDDEFSEIFGNDSNIFFLFHGYVSVLKSLMFERLRNKNVAFFGYDNKSYTSVNTLGKFKINGASRYDIYNKILDLLYSEKIITQGIYETEKNDIKKIIEAD